MSEDVGEWTVDRVMKKPVHTIEGDEDIETATEHMIRHKINRLPVVDATGQLIGIVTRHDIMEGSLRAVNARCGGGRLRGARSESLWL